MISLERLKSNDRRCFGAWSDPLRVDADLFRGHRMNADTCLLRGGSLCERCVEMVGIKARSARAEGEISEARKTLRRVLSVLWDMRGKSGKWL